VAIFTCFLFLGFSYFCVLIFLSSPHIAVESDLTRPSSVALSKYFWLFSLLILFAMTWLSHLNPIPAFPEYTGPYDVGSVDVEVPAADLPSPSSKPEGAAPTVAFRLFYPCEAPPSESRPVRWIPQPQRQHIAAFAKFLGVGSRLSQAFA